MAQKMAFFIHFLVFSVFLQGAFGELVCEELPVGMCAFSIASTGKRCLLENYVKSNGDMEYQCKTSEIVVKSMSEWIESDECISSCGVDRQTVGISSDSLLEPHFTARLCSPSCYYNCPNIVDLYHNLAIGEGAFLSNLCEVHKNLPRRAMAQLLSSGAALGPISAANGPVLTAEAPYSGESSESVACAPTSI